MGAVTPIGEGVPEFTRGLRAGRSGVGLLPFTHRMMRSSVGARCGEFEPGSVLSGADVARLPRSVPLALSAARQALSRAGLAVGEPAGAGEARRVGLVLGTGAGGIDFTLDQAEAVMARGGRGSLWTITNATHGNLAGELSIRLGLRGPSLCVSTGCASSSDAAGLALEMLRSARHDVPRAMVVVGADAHVRWEVLASMELLRVVSTRDYRADPGAAATASRPFDATRDGFVLGEGAWAVVLEREGDAAERGARPLGQLLGYAATCDAYHRVRPSPDLSETVRAIAGAVTDAGLAPGDIEMVHYHGTATPLNDRVEVEAMKGAFGPHAASLRGTSVKSMIGHPQGACGLASLVASLGALCNADGGRGPFIPPTINLSEPDPACDLDFTPRHATPTDSRTVLVNCLAFGAKNSALVARAVGSWEG